MRVTPQNLHRPGNFRLIGSAARNAAPPSPCSRSGVRGPPASIRRRHVFLLERIVDIPPDSSTLETAERPHLNVDFDRASGIPARSPICPRPPRRLSLSIRAEGEIPLSLVLRRVRIPIAPFSVKKFHLASGFNGISRRSLVVIYFRAMLLFQSLLLWKIGRYRRRSSCLHRLRIKSKLYYHDGPLNRPVYLSDERRFSRFLASRSVFRRHVFFRGSHTGNKRTQSSCIRAKVVSLLLRLTSVIPQWSSPGLTIPLLSPGC